MSAARRNSRLPRLLRSPSVFLPALQLLQWALVLLWAHRFVNQSGTAVWLAMVLALPVALYCVYRLAREIGGPSLGALAAGVWVVAPFAMAHFFDPRYRYQYENQIVPRALGLIRSGEFPTMVVLLVACLLTLGALRRGRPRAYLAGLAAGFAAMIDAVGLLFVPAALLALLAARRRELIVPFALGLAPGIVVVLARGTGDGIGFGSWHQIHHNAIFIREFFYSLRVLEWLPVAGVLAIGRRSIPAALLIGGWFGMFLVVRGSSTDINDYGFWRFMLPALPPYVLLTAAIPLLAPAPRAFREIFLVRGRPGSAGS